MSLRTKADEADRSERMPEILPLHCGCNIGEMPRKVPVKCAIADCYRGLKVTLAQREDLRGVGRGNSAMAGVVCSVHVKAAVSF